ncbi:methyl-accepting chemotaxis protein [Algibacillus agarilyticus]|uniref:methyl-accepting chemotaxis protein n=1 Tax=Algibacillus agarilyticus TaxID=2234133 RepID=UPI000DCF7389|nr:methyl-accepting chemotaxis protein [Algibacillus agarilyticus]
MQILTQFKIQTRIIFLVLIPLIVTFMLSLERLSDANEEQDKMQLLDNVLNYAGVASPYVAATLNEAFYTRLYIDSTDQKTSQYKRALEDARRKALLRQKQYVKFIDDNREALAQFQVLNTHIQALRGMIKNFAVLRKAADKKVHLLKEGGRDVHTMYEMTVMIRRLVLTLSEMVVIASQNEQLGKMSNAYYSLMSASTESSFHNSFVFSAMNNLDVYIYGAIFRGATKMQSDHELFQSFASPQARAAYNKMVNSAVYQTAEKVALQARTNIYQNVNKPLVIEGNIDWDETTADLFQLYQVTIDAVLTELIETKNILLSESEAQVYKTLGMMLTLLVTISVISYVIAHSITNPLRDFVKTFSTLARDKDMECNIPVEGSDELTELTKAFNSLLDSFRTTLKGVKAETCVINEATASVATSMDESAALSNNQLQATDSISVAINEMAATIKEVAGMATSTSDIVQKAYDISVESSKNAETSKTMMENLTVELGNTSDVVKKLNEETNLIGNVLNVIQGIAEQTNLLALNAAIEAARAGEQGRGFAVVADEVRSLAGRTQESTEQIRKQIETLQKGAEAATQNMLTLQDEGTKAVEIVLESASAFGVMKAELDTITQMAIQIATASEEQTSVSNEINERIISIRDDTDLITSKTNETTLTAQNLKDTSDRLNEYISEFKGC